MEKSGKYITGVYPGTFDPVTKGHLHLIRRASRMVDKLIIAVADSPKKGPLFSHEERLEMLRADIENMPEKGCEIEVRSFNKLLVHFARDVGATCIFRGLRAVSDFEYEFQMTGMNYQLNPDIETIFLMTSEKNSFISSNFVKEVHKLGGDVSNFVSKNTLEQLNKKNS